LLSQKFRGYPLGFDGFYDYVTVSVTYAQLYYCFVVLILCTPLNCGAGVIFFFFLVVCDDDERTARR
jgi:hypothetical protein